MASFAATDAWYELEPHTACADCQRPLGPHRVWRIVRDDSPPEVIAAVRDGSINKIRHTCGCAAWITSPVLWIDRKLGRAVFVQGGTWTPEAVAAERTRLLEHGLADVAEPLRSLILSRLQEERYHHQIPMALAVDNDEAESERRGHDAVETRKGLSPDQRLDDVLSRATSGQVGLASDELTPEFLAALRRRLDALNPDDDDVTAQVIRGLWDALADRAAPEQASRGRSTEQLGIAQRELAAARTEGDHDVLIVALTRAGMAHVDVGRHQVAGQYFSEAHDHIAEAIGARRVTQAMATCLPLVQEGLGAFHRAERSYDLGAHAYDAAAQNHARLADVGGQVRALAAAAEMYGLLGELDRATERYRRVVDIAGPDSIEGATSLANLGQTLARGASRPELVAAFTYRHSGAGTPVLPPLPRDLSNGQQRMRVEVTLENAAGERRLVLEDVVGDPAVDAAKHAVAVFERAGNAELARRAYLGLAAVYLHYGLRLAAQGASTAAAGRAPDGHAPDLSEHFVHAGLWNSVADAAWKRGDVVAARAAWQAVLDGSAEVAARNRGSRFEPIEVHLLLSRGVALEGLERDDEALALYRAAEAWFDGNRHVVTEENHRREAQKVLALTHQRLARAALTLSGRDPSLLAEVFRATEASRTRLLLEDLALVAGATSNVFDAPAEPLDAAQVAAMLAPDTALVTYSLVPEHSNRRGAWVISAILPSGAESRFVNRELEAVWEAREGCVAVIKSLVGAHETSASRDAWLEELIDGRAAFDEALAALGELLLPSELLDACRDAGVTRLAVVPEAYLVDVPFAALRVRCRGTLDYLVGRPGEDSGGFDVTVAPSASAYSALQQRSDAPDGDRHLLQIVDANGDLALARDWSAARPAWTHTRLNGEGATIAAMTAAVGGADALVFFGHGHYDEHEPRASGLELADGSLTAQMVLDDSTLDWRRCCRVILLACSGARVDMTRDWAAREQNGFAIAVLSRGARDVAGAIWPLVQRIAREVGDVVLDQLATGCPIDTALRRATHAVMSMGDGTAPWTHPFFWGGLRVTGSGRSRLA